MIVPLPALPGVNQSQSFSYMFFQHNISITATSPPSIFEVGYILSDRPSIDDNDTLTVAEIDIRTLTVSMIELPPRGDPVIDARVYIDTLTGYRTYAMMTCPWQLGCTRCHFYQYALAPLDSPMILQVTPIEHAAYNFVPYDYIDASRWAGSGSDSALVFSVTDDCDGTVLEILRIDTSTALVTRSVSTHAKVVLSLPMLTVDASGELIYIFGKYDNPLFVLLFNATTFQVT